MKVLCFLIVILVSDSVLAGKGFQERQPLPEKIFLPDTKINKYKIENLKEYLSNYSKDNSIEIYLEYKQCRSESNPNEMVKYLHMINTPQKDMKLIVNGVEMKGYRFEFELRKDCTLLSPINFISAKKQKFRNFSIKKNDLIETTVNSKWSHLEGVIGEDGYIEESVFSKIVKKKTKTKKELQFLRSFEGVLTADKCIKITNKIKSKVNYYFNGKLFDSSEVIDDFLSGPTLYWGNKICSDNVKAKLVCGAYDLDYEHEFGINAEDLEEKKRSMAEYLAQKKECDNRVKAFEQKTGKKVPISPHIPKKYIERIKKNSMTMFER